MNCYMRPNGEAELRDLIDVFPQNIIMCEIGSFAGESAELFCKSNKILRIYCIDSWENNYDIDDPVCKFDLNTIEKEFDERHLNNNKLVKIKKRSVLASKEFNDYFFDVVYIDGDHRYQFVKDDIKYWISKIKPGGIMCGHDYDLLDVQRATSEFFEIDKVLNGNWVKLL